MATTQNTFNGNGSNLGPFSFTFKWLESTDIKVSVGGVLKTAGTHYNLQGLNYTTKTGGQVLFTAGNAPPTGTSNIRIYRDTDDEALSAVFSSGSAIRAKDLNDNFTQNLYVTQEVNNNSVNIDGSNAMVGPLNMNGFQIDNLAEPTENSDAATKSYVDARFGTSSIPGHTRWRKVATASQTIFSGTGDYGGVLAYSPTREQVYINGALQQRGVDYAADNGTSVIFTVGLTVGDVVDIICVNNLTNSAISNAGNITYSGQFTGQTARTVAAKLTDVVSVKDFIPEGTDTANTDCTAYIQAAFAATPDGAKLVFPGGIYKLTGSVDVSNRSISVDAEKAKFLVVANVAAFKFDASGSAQIYSLSSNYTLGSTSIAVSAMAAALKDGQAFKIVSNAVDPANRDSGSSANQYRVGEWTTASGGTTTSITLRNPLRFSRGIDPTSAPGEEPKIDSFTTAQNARVVIPGSYSLTWVGGTIEYEDGHDGDNWNKPAFTVIGYSFPEISGLSIRRGYQAGIAINGCIDAKVTNCKITNLTDNTGLGQFGYGVADSGSLRTVVQGCTFSNTRHGFTTTNPTIASNSTDAALLLRSGRTQSGLVADCVAYGKTVAAFDTHHDAENTTFSNCTAEGGAVGFAGRGRGLVYENCQAVNVDTGYSIFTELQSGDPDDDLYVAGKPEGATTAILRNCTAHALQLPVNLNQCRSVVIDTLNLKNTNQQMVSVNGSVVSVSGTHQYTVTNYDSTQLITEATNKGIFDLLPVAAALSSYWDPTLTILDGASVTVDATAATDASNNMLFVRASTAGMYLNLYGTLRGQLSQDFSTLLSANLNTSGGENGGIFWGINGAADNTITTNLLGKYCKARADDKTIIHDWVTPSIKPLVKHPQTAHVGTGSTITNVYRPEVESSAYLNEDGHTINYRLWFRKTGAVGVTTFTLRIGGDLLHTTTIPAGSVGAYAVVDIDTTGANNQICNVAWFAYNSSSQLDTTANGQYKYSLETADLSALSGYVLRVDVNAAVGDTVYLDKYEVSCDLLSDGVI